MSSRNPTTTTNINIITNTNTNINAAWLHLIWLYFI